MRWATRPDRPTRAPSKRTISGLPLRMTSTSRPTHNPIAINRAMALPDVKEKLNAAGLIVLNESPEYFATLLKNDYAKYAKLVRDIKFEPQ